MVSGSMPTNHALVRWLFLGTVVLLARSIHSAFLWVEEAYPYAGTVQFLLVRRTPYIDFFYDKPPFGLFFAALWHASPGFPGRLAGALYVVACCLLIHHMAKSWIRNEGSPALSSQSWWPTLLLAVGLTFYIPAAVIPLAPDLLMILPHLAAIHFARQQRAGWAGLCVGLAIWTNSKGILVALTCGLWSPAAAILGLGIGALQLLIPGNWEQVWQWGWIYSSDTFLEHPFTEGLRRTLNWSGFHAAALVGTACYFLNEKRDRLRPALWLVLSLAGVAGGWRFFPRYYFQLLPVVALLGGMGLARMAQSRRWINAVALSLLLIPIARFGPRYITLALQGEGDWADTALNRDSRAVSARILAEAKPSDTILVWGYRPDILVYTHLPLGAPYLDSQPLTGVLADRHLTDSRPTVAELAAANRKRLLQDKPDWLVDGLGPINARLAVVNYPDLTAWMENYREVFRTPSSVVYRRKS